MAEIVNLNKYRKARKRAEEATGAAGNRVRHGRSKTERTQTLADISRSERGLDDKRIDRPDDDQEPA